MAVKDIGESYHKLKREVEKHSDLYYNQDSPVISDFEFDMLMYQLKQMESDYPELATEESPTVKVGGRAVSGVTIRHQVPMLSLRNVFSQTEVMDFC